MKKDITNPKNPSPLQIRTMRIAKEIVYLQNRNARIRQVGNMGICGRIHKTIET